MTWEDAVRKGYNGGMGLSDWQAVGHVITLVPQNRGGWERTLWYRWLEINLSPREELWCFPESDFIVISQGYEQQAMLFKLTWGGK